ncbi:hypothetical protein HPP92_015951 [Vanilla planifolia]|uniref:Uncharacterized protein n=1 Tax=Vanilla planifolia TaxID=51239 RepID=A0A835QED3_VANPL|nr:hypothetical protein HPP92_016588 [Vanilla planifolia]KAG0471405.1 hypothetical protein HPP92_015951 [Vanilla planifolia]
MNPPSGRYRNGGTLFCRQISGECLKILKLDWANYFHGYGGWAPAIAVRSSLEEMLESLRQRDEKPKMFRRRCPTGHHLGSSTFCQEVSARQFQAWKRRIFNLTMGKK